MLFHPTTANHDFPRRLGGMTVVPEWSDVLPLVEAQQRGRGQGASGQARLRAVVYPCSSIQVLARGGG